MYKLFIKKSLTWIASILALVYIFNYVIDPYNMNNTFDLNLNKQKVSYKKHYRLFKMNEFINSPNSTIILGDSRGAALRREYFDELGVNSVFNFAYGGGTLYEIINTFWFATEYTKLTKVYISIPFNIFNENNRMDLTKEAINLINNKATTYMNPFISKVSILNIIDKFFPVKIEQPSQLKEDFWLHQLGSVTNSFYSNYIYPKNLLKSLDDIASFCKDNNIKLYILIPPTHIDLQKKVLDYNLQSEYREYKSYLKDIAYTLDYDTDNTITIDKNNFSDPYHFNESIAKLIVKDLIDL